jgi:Asp-tRNA(Asn)/Glu-tRNA(Gln) amidotransferase B subunit
METSFGRKKKKKSTPTPAQQLIELCKEPLITKKKIKELVEGNTIDENFEKTIKSCIKKLKVMEIREKDEKLSDHIKSIWIMLQKHLLIVKGKKL